MPLRQISHHPCACVGTGAFSYCSALTSATISSSVNSIGEYAFLYNSSITTVIFETTSLDTYGTESFDACSSSLTIWVPNSAAVTTYKEGNDGSWSGYNIPAMSYTLTAYEVNDAYWCTYYNSYGNFTVDANTPQLALTPPTCS